MNYNSHMSTLDTQIQHHLNNQITLLKQPTSLPTPSDLVEFIYRRLTTSQYRRHSISAEYQAHIRQVITTAIAHNAPIPLVWVFGCYKLWRLPEAPFVDWAELFFLLHKVEWLKPILAVYPPGVWFDFFADGTIVAQLNHLSQSDLDQYQSSFLELLDFVQTRVPANLHFTLHTLLEQYPTPQEFATEFATNLAITRAKYKLSRPELSPAQRSVIAMNVKADHPLSEAEYLESQTLFDAFILSSKRRPYYRTPTKIFLDSFAISNTLPIRTTRSSTVRFWIGAGVLRPSESGFIEDIFSVTQLSQAKFHSSAVTLQGLPGPNFRQIRLLTN